VNYIIVPYGGIWSEKQIEELRKQDEEESGNRYWIRRDIERLFFRIHSQLASRGKPWSIDPYYTWVISISQYDYFHRLKEKPHKQVAHSKTI
jgi:hypothetical protein